MKRVVFAFAFLDLLGLLGLSYKSYNILYSLKDNRVLEYEYVDYNGNKGTSKHCYKNENNLICRNGKNGVSVIKYKEKRG